jgi:hypothetical protein
MDLEAKLELSAKTNKLPELASDLVLLNWRKKDSELRPNLRTSSFLFLRKRQKKPKAWPWVFIGLQSSNQSMVQLPPTSWRSASAAAHSASNASASSQSMHSETSVVPSYSQVQVKSFEQEAKAPTAKKAKNTFFMVEKIRVKNRSAS